MFVIQLSHWKEEDENLFSPYFMGIYKCSNKGEMIEPEIDNEEDAR